MSNDVFFSSDIGIGEDSFRHHHCRDKHGVPSRKDDMHLPEKDLQAHFAFLVGVEGTLDPYTEYFFRSTQKQLL
jgi:hypothetical protein